MPLRALFGPIVDFALPPRCPICGVTVVGDNRFCLSCWQQLDFLAKPWCAACGIPLVFEHPGENLCVKCLVDKPDHDGVRAVVRYDDLSALIAMRLKYGTRLGLAKLIAGHLQKYVADCPEGSIIVPVPLHRWRLWQRGFNQAALLSRELARLGKGEALVDGLERRKATPNLGGLGREARERALAGAIAVNRRRQPRIAGRDVVLVDDVFTSGATARACIAALAEAGARSIAIACFARVDDAMVRDR